MYFEIEKKLTGFENFLQASPQIASINKTTNKNIKSVDKKGVPGSAASKIPDTSKNYSFFLNLTYYCIIYFEKS